MTLISLVANELKTQMESSPLFPFSDRKNYPLSKITKPHMKTSALKNNPIIIVSPEVEYFEIGNEYAEKTNPYYHILEDAKVIRNPNKGTPQSLGTQRSVKQVGKRDYGKVTYIKSGGKTRVGQEYRTAYKNRSNIWNVNTTLYLKRFNMRNEKRNYRYNIHFGYIERILEEITPTIAEQINARLIVRDVGFAELDENVIIEQGEEYEGIEMSDYEDTI